jgi:hypothetical protein
VPLCLPRGGRSIPSNPTPCYTKHKSRSFYPSRPESIHIQLFVISRDNTSLNLIRSLEATLPSSLDVANDSGITIARRRCRSIRSILGIHAKLAETYIPHVGVVPLIPQK